MKDTIQIRNYVKDVSARTQNYLDIQKVKIVFTIQDWNKYHKSHQMRKSNLLGRASLNQGKPVIFINIDIHKSIKSLNDTIVHEHYHIKDMNLNHGKNFDFEVQRITSKLFDYGYDHEGKIKKYEGVKY